MKFPFGANRDEDADRKVILVITAFLGLLLLTAVLRWQYSGFGDGVVTIGDDVTVHVDVAASDATRERGLSGRASLGADEGVLFLFSVPAQYVFWMKDMRFPIDALWIRDGVIVDITTDVQPPGPDEVIPRFFPVEPADTVLEVGAGFARRHGLRLGMPVTIDIDRRGALR